MQTKRTFFFIILRLSAWELNSSLPRAHSDAPTSTRHTEGQSSSRVCNHSTAYVINHDGTRAGKDQGERANTLSDKFFHGLSVARNSRGQPCDGQEPEGEIRPRDQSSFSIFRLHQTAKKKVIMGGKSVQAISAQNELSSLLICCCASAKNRQSEAKALLTFGP